MRSRSTSITTTSKKRSLKRIRSIRSGDTLNDPGLKSLLISCTLIYDSSQSLITKVRQLILSMTPMAITTVSVTRTVLDHHLNDTKARPEQNLNARRMHACMSSIITSNNGNLSSSKSTQGYERFIIDIEQTVLDPLLLQIKNIDNLRDRLVERENLKEEYEKLNKIVSKNNKKINSGKGTLSSTSQKTQKTQKMMDIEVRREEVNLLYMNVANNILLQASDLHENRVELIENPIQSLISAQLRFYSFATSCLRLISNNKEGLPKRGNVIVDNPINDDSDSAKYSNPIDLNNNLNIISSLPPVTVNDIEHMMKNIKTNIKNKKLIEKKELKVIKSGRRLSKTSMSLSAPLPPSTPPARSSKFSTSSRSSASSSPSTSTSKSTLSTKGHRNTNQPPIDVPIVPTSYVETKSNPVTPMAKAWAKRKINKQNQESDSEEDDGEDNTGADPSALRIATESLIHAAILTEQEGEEVYSLIRRGRIQRASLKLSELVETNNNNNNNNNVDKRDVRDDNGGGGENNDVMIVNDRGIIDSDDEQGSMNDGMMIVMGGPPPESPESSSSEKKKKKKKEKKKKEKKQKKKNKKKKKDKKNMDDEWDNDVSDNDNGEEEEFGTFTIQVTEKEPEKKKEDVVEQEEHKVAKEEEEKDETKTEQVTKVQDSKIKVEEVQVEKEIQFNEVKETEKEPTIVDVIVSKIACLGDVETTDDNCITLIQLQHFFQACNKRLKRKDDSSTRGQKVFTEIKKKEKISLNEGQVAVTDVSNWLIQRFSKTPAVLNSFHEVAINL